MQGLAAIPPPHHIGRDHCASAEIGALRHAADETADSEHAKAVRQAREQVAKAKQHHHFVVCFEKNPKPADAERYSAAGLIWCTLKTLPQLLVRIDLEAAGVSIPFIHTTQKFSYKVEFDDGTATPAEVRSHFLATVDATKAATAAQEAKDSADFAAGIAPF
jgi:hypothetical protein